MLFSLPAVLAVNWIVGIWEETILISARTWMYNDLGGGDQDFVTRKLLIGCGFGVYNRVALRIACGGDHEITRLGYQWIAPICCVVFTRMQVQDMKDQKGDRARGRRSIPLAFGDWVAWWTIAVPVLT